jgi:3-oxoadipate enol-lactonase
MLPLGAPSEAEARPVRAVGGRFSTGAIMPKIRAGSLSLNYEQQGSGEPLLLIPYLGAEHACYAFQVADYSKHFTCIAIDPRGTGESDDPGGPYTTEMLADDIAALVQALGLGNAHVFGLSLGGAAAMWLAAKYPRLVKSLSLHSTWPATDGYIRAVVSGWQVMARALASTAETTIQGIFPWCFTPQLYACRPDYVDSLAAFVRSRPAMPVDAFIRQSDAVIAHDVEARLASITAPAQITFGRHDAVTSTRFADRLRNGIRRSELRIFEDCSHAPIYEDVASFNDVTLAFLRANAG